MANGLVTIPTVNLSAHEAEEVMEALRSGAVPRQHAQEFTVGRDRYLSALAGDLAFVANGGYKVRLLVGNWGFGKTHVLSLLGRDAAQAGFVVSHVELHAREAPLERAEAIVAAIVRNAQFPDGLDSEGYLRHWATTAPLTEMDEIENWLRSASPNPEFRAILRAILANPRPLMSGDVTVDAVRWLTGSAASPQLTQSTGLRTAMKSAVAADLLGSFIGFAVTSGCRGLVLLLDEAEAITSLTRAQQRDEANRTLRRLVDNTDQRTHCEVVFATTRRFVDDAERGARSYPALWTRLSTLTGPTLFNPRATVLELEPLSHDEIIELTRTLAAIHAVAYHWEPPITETTVRQIAKASSDGHLSPRGVVRTLVTVLDLTQNGIEIDTHKLVEEIGRAEVA